MPTNTFSTLPQGLEFCLDVLSILFSIRMGINVAITFSESLQNGKLPSETEIMYYGKKERKKKKISFNLEKHKQKKIIQHMYPIRGSNPESSRTKRGYLYK